MSAPASEAPVDDAPLDTTETEVKLSQFAEARNALFKKDATTAVPPSSTAAAPPAPKREQSQFKEALASLKLAGSGKVDAVQADSSRGLSEAERQAVAQTRAAWQRDGTGLHSDKDGPAAKSDRDLSEEEKKRVAALRANWKAEAAHSTPVVPSKSTEHVTIDQINASKSGRVSPMATETVEKETREGFSVRAARDLTEEERKRVADLRSGWKKVEDRKPGEEPSTIPRPMDPSRGLTAEERERVRQTRLEWLHSSPWQRIFDNTAPIPERGLTDEELQRIAALREEWKHLSEEQQAAAIESFKQGLAKAPRRRSSVTAESIPPEFAAVQDCAAEVPPPLPTGLDEDVPAPPPLPSLPEPDPVISDEEDAVPNDMIPLEPAPIETESESGPPQAGVASTEPGSDTEVELRAETLPPVLPMEEQRSESTFEMVTHSPPSPLHASVLSGQNDSFEVVDGLGVSPAQGSSAFEVVEHTASNEPSPFAGSSDFIGVDAVSSAAELSPVSAPEVARQPPLEQPVIVGPDPIVSPAVLETPMDSLPSLEQSPSLYVSSAGTSEVTATPGAYVANDSTSSRVSVATPPAAPLSPPPVPFRSTASETYSDWDALPEKPVVTDTTSRIWQEYCDEVEAKLKRRRRASALQQLNQHKSAAQATVASRKASHLRAEEGLFAAELALTESSSSWKRVASLVSLDGNDATPRMREVLIQLKNRPLPTAG